MVLWAWLRPFPGPSLSHRKTGHTESRSDAADTGQRQSNSRVAARANSTERRSGGFWRPGSFRTKGLSRPAAGWRGRCSQSYRRCSWLKRLFGAPWWPRAETPACSLREAGAQSLVKGRGTPHATWCSQKLKNTEFSTGQDSEDSE